MKPIQISLLVAMLCVAAWSQTSEITRNFVVKDKKGVAVKTLSDADVELTDHGTSVKAKLMLRVQFSERPF